MLKVVTLRFTRNLSVLPVFPFSYSNVYGPCVCWLDANIFTSSNGFTICNLTLCSTCWKYWYSNIRSVRMIQWVGCKAVQMSMKNYELDRDLFIHCDLHFHFNFGVNWFTHCCFNSKEWTEIVYQSTIVTIDKNIIPHYLKQAIDG